MIFKETFPSAAKFLAAVVLSVFGLSSAHALVIDTKIGSANLANSGDSTELAAIKAASGDSTLTFLSKIDAQTGTAIADPSVAGQFFINLSSFNSGLQTPAYFALKFGTGGTSSLQNTFFFRNIDDLTKLVFSNTQVNFLSGGDCGARGDADSCNIGRLSHFDTFGGGNGGGGSSGSVPEPTSITLLGLGLLAFAIARRKSEK